MFAATSRFVKSPDNVATVDVKPWGVFAVNRSHSSRRRLRAKGMPEVGP
jgi:hypothetical protein